MAELWDIYDVNKQKTGKSAERGVYLFKDGEYHIVVEAVILNLKNELLISKRAEHKKYGGLWEINGGSILLGETSLQGVIREIKEELGIVFNEDEATFLKTTRREKAPPNFRDFWVFKRDIGEREITFPDKEATEAKWVTIDEFLKMFDNGEVVPNNEFWREDYNRALKLLEREAYSYIQKDVKVKIDRPKDSKHPKHGFVYPVNYGYIENTVSGDGEELDCYVLGINEPIQEFEGKCIAIIHRTNDDDDKLIVVPEGESYTDEEIRKLTNFQEQYFESEIIR